MSGPCLAVITIPNGERVSACHLDEGHTGTHEGWCLGSRAVWGDDAADTLNEPVAADAQFPGGERP